MATLVTVTRAQLIDEALDWLYQAQERPRPVRIGTDDLADADDTSLTLHAADHGLVFETSILELRQELMLVTVKSTDENPVFTVSRGYASTPNVEGAVLNDELLLSPTYGRYKVATNVARFFDGPANTWLPRKVTASYTRVTDMQLVELPADTMRVLSVRYSNTETGRLIYLDDGYIFHDDLPAAISSTGKALKTPTLVSNTDELIIVTQEPYAWTEPDPDTTVHDEDDTIDLPAGSQDLPALYAAAYTATGRELQRAELDSIEEWNQDEVIRTGANVRLINQLWSTFYRRLDEARRIHGVPKRREYRARVGL